MGEPAGVTELPWREARRVAHDSAVPLPAGDVPLAEALGTTLAAPLNALAPLPAFDAAAMDGYAVAGASPWTVAGSVLAGQRERAAKLRPGEAVEVATGAAVPEGTDGVLPYESARRTGDGVTGPVEAGRHVRREGEDYRRGEELLASGVAVTPTVLGLAASAGYDALRVRRSPRVAILVTGDELTDTGLPGAGRVRDAIGPLLPGLVSAYGGTPHRVTRLSDDAASLVEALTTADADVVAICGASSKGPADHLRDVLAEVDAEILVDGVACRPGHPQLLARIGGRVLVGLPGNPYAAVAAVLTLLAPLLGGLAGWRPRPPERAGLARDVRAHPADTRLIAVRRCRGRAEPVGHDRPGLLWGAALADALAVVPPGWGGEEVELLPLPARYAQ